MEIYLVGGAVRDTLLGLAVKERDWVVVGATPAEMLQRGYKQVGKDFPVFLHPTTHEEYALARVERKVGRGYTGFDFDASPSVTLEQDLLRRDLTINAIAQHSDGELVDPYQGQQDLTQKILRHVSPAFVEDPVRVLRVGRFAARFATLGFCVADETIALMRAMVDAGEVDALVAERVWKELSRALEEATPAAFFKVLQACGALPLLFPAITSAGLLQLQRMAAHSQEADVRFAALLAAVSPADVLALCDRYRVPSQFRELAILVATHATTCARAKTLQATEWLAVLRATDAFRREARFEKFLLVSEVITTTPLPFVKAILQAAKQVDVQSLTASGVTGSALAAAIDVKRVELIDDFLLSQQPKMSN